jgi:hypothetical protein
MSKISDRIHDLWRTATKGDDSLSAATDTIAALQAVLITRIFTLLAVCPEMRDRLPVRVIGDVNNTDPAVFGSVMTVEFLTDDVAHKSDEIDVEMVVVTVGAAKGTRH